MRGLQNSQRVSWATDGNLCQVKLFLSEDSPSLVGAATQDHLQPKKKSVHLYNTGPVAVPEDCLPPGFEGVNPEIQLLKNKLTQIPLVKWICPSRFILDPSCRVTSGEESDDVKIQNQRELRVLEAIYPRPSAIPPNPAVSLDAEGLICDDSKTPLVPITPIEEEEDAPEELSNESSLSALPHPPPPGFAQGVLPSSQYASASVPKTNFTDSAQQQSVPASSRFRGVRQRKEGKWVAEIRERNSKTKKWLGYFPTAIDAAMAYDEAARAKYGHSAQLNFPNYNNNPKTVLHSQNSMDSGSTHSQVSVGDDPKMKIEDRQGKLIDPELLVKILNNPAILEEFMKRQQGNSSMASSSSSSSSQSQIPQMIPSPAPVIISQPHFSQVEKINLPTSTLNSVYPPQLNGKQLPVSFQHPPATLNHNTAVPGRDINYFKSLIQQHGGDMQQQLQQQITLPPFTDHHQGLNPEPRPKFNKPCGFFNSPKGCRHGANCTYQHDLSHQQRESSIPEMQSAKRMKTGMRGSHQPYS